MTKSGAHTADISQRYLTSSHSNDLMNAHGSRNCWKVTWHPFQCLLNSFIFDKIQFDRSLCFREGLEQLTWIVDVPPMAYKVVCWSFYGSTNSIWCTFAMTRLKKVPGTSQASLVKLCTKQENVSLLLVLCTGPITKKVHNRHLGVCFPHGPVQVSNVPIWQVESCAWMMRWR